MKNTRRDFLKTAAAGAAGAGLAMSVPASSHTRIMGANRRITVGLVGRGRMMQGHLRNLLEMLWSPYRGPWALLSVQSSRFKERTWGP